MKPAVKRCYGCKTEHPTAEFHRDRSRRDGFANVCKSCDREKQRDRSRRKQAGRPPKPVPKAGHKFCTRCLLELPNERFRRHRSSADGLYSWCRDCVNSESRRKTAERRAAAGLPPIGSGRDPEKKRATDRQYYARNRERLIEKGRERYDSDKARAYQTSRRQQDRWIFALQNGRVRARRSGVEYEVFDGFELEAYWAEHGIPADDCYLCGGPAEQLDHVHALSTGGTHTKDNLRPVCERDNLDKRARRPQDFVVSRGGTPEAPSDVALIDTMVD